MLDAWIAAHAPGNVAPLFASFAPNIALSNEAEALLQRVDLAGSRSIYVVCLRGSRGQLTPVYIGMTMISAWRRWTRSHMQYLRYSQQRRIGTYKRWLQVFERTDRGIALLCLTESAITAPPLPGFPTTVREVENQLIALAAAAYPGRC